MNKTPVVPTSLRSLLLTMVFLSAFSWPLNARALTPLDIYDLTHGASQSIIRLADPGTGLSPSLYGHPGFENLTFIYDAAVMAMILKAAGNQGEAERIIDYFTQRLHIPRNEIVNNSDANKTYGILKLFGKDSPALGLINAVDRTSIRKQGKGELEYLTTPGPTAFLIMAMLQVNKAKYLYDAVILGETLLAMQRPDGAVSDGDRTPGRVHTEPHADTVDVFYQLFELTQDMKWKQAADRASAWFMNNVYLPRQGAIHQGIWENGPSAIFATDAYSWTMAGKLGDAVPLDALERLTGTMLAKSLVRVTLEFPGGKSRTIISVDFTDAKDPDVIKARGGFHPVGSPEWTGGVILALQKNAVRFWNAGSRKKARNFKAIAELLTDELLKAAYEVKGFKMFFYATGQGVAVGHGWKTPFFYAKNPSGGIEGGSFIGAWGVLPINGVNPFVLDDDYFSIYRQINISAGERKRAADHVNSIVADRSFQENVPTHFPDPRTQVVEPGQYNLHAWQAFEKKDYNEAIVWAQKVIDDPVWVRLAQEEQGQKSREIGGLIAYPWGTTFRGNNNPLHIAIWKYPILNEVAAAMWILAASHYELGNREESKKWMKRILLEVSYHQIPNVVYDPDTGKKNLINGYWNASVSWSMNPGHSKRDEQMGSLIKEMALNVEPPQIVNRARPAMAIQPRIFAIIQSGIALPLWPPLAPPAKSR